MGYCETFRDGLAETAAWRGWRNWLSVAGPTCPRAWRALPRTRFRVQRDSTREQQLHALLCRYSTAAGAAQRCRTVLAIAETLTDMPDRVLLYAAASRDNAGHALHDLAEGLGLPPALTRAVDREAAIPLRIAAA